MKTISGMNRRELSKLGIIKEDNYYKIFNRRKKGEYYAELLQNYLLEDKEIKLELDKFGEINWKDSLYIIKQLFRPVKMQL